MTPITSPAESTLKTPTPIPRSWRSGVKNVSAKNPKTTVGMPASVSSAGLSDAARPRLRVLAQEDRGAEPEREADDAGPERDDERPDEQRLDAERGGLEERGPAVAREEVDERDLAEELDRRLEQRDDDPDRRRDRDEGAEGEDDLDDVLAPAPAVGAQPDRGRLRACGHVGRCHAG